jgi:MFS family permease
MVMGMSMVSIMLQQFGVGLTLINLAVSIHVIGMYGLSIPWGWLTDRRGRRLVMALGGVILGTGAFLMPITSEYLIVTFGVFLVGLGWSATNVASTALICDITPGSRRGSIMGANDVANGLASMTFPSVGGAILSSLGFFALGVAGLLVALPVVLSVLPIREPPR